MTDKINQVSTHNSIILFDGVCNFCDNTINFIIRNDKKNVFKFTALQSETAKQISKDYSFEGLNSIILIKNGKLFKKSDAILHILKELTGFSSLFVLIYIPRPVRDFAYWIIARMRYIIFGKKKTCIIPTPEIRSKFL